MPHLLLSLLADPALSGSSQIKASDDGGIKVEGAKASGFFGRIAQGLRRFFSSEIQGRNREGITAYLSQLHEEDPDLEAAARAELAGRLSSGQPLTLRRIREIGNGALARSAQAKAENLLKGLFAKTTPELTEGDYGLLLKAKSSLALVKAHGPQSPEFDRIAGLVNQRLELYELRIGEKRGEGGFLN